MKHKLGIITLIVFTAILVYSLTRDQHEPDELQHVTKPVEVAPVAEVPHVEHPAEPDPKLVASVVNSMKQKESQKINAEELAVWLEKTGRSANSLIAAFAVNKDISLIDEALKKEPNNPLCLMASAMYSATEQRNASIVQLQTLFPTAAFPDYLAAKLAFENGEGAEAIKALQAASKKGEIKDFTEDLHSVFTQMFIDIKSMEPWKASHNTLAYDSLEPKNTLLSLAHTLEDNMKTDTGSKVAEKAALGLSTAQHLAETKDLTRYRQSLHMESEFLKYLQANGSETYLNKPIQQYISEVDAERLETKNLLSLMVALNEAGGAEYVKFLAREKEIGNMAALKEIKARSEK
jgi:hypothetical protein